MEKSELVALYNRQSDKYAKLSKRKKTFDTVWRKQLLSFAKGSILEVAVGAGINFKFYPPGVQITAVDLSPDMVERARESAADAGIQANIFASSIEALDFPAASFDTIVSTLSVCTYENPVRVLRLLKKWCAPDGWILLLEHGRSKYTFLQWLQNRFDGFQYRKIGCHANRDMLDIARQSGLKIAKCERKLFGIMYLIWAKPGEKPDAE